MNNLGKIIKYGNIYSNQKGEQAKRLCVCIEDLDENFLVAVSMNVFAREDYAPWLNVMILVPSFVLLLFHNNI